MPGLAMDSINDDVDGFIIDPEALASWMASSEVDQKALGNFAAITSLENPFLSAVLYKILGLSVMLSKKLLRARRLRRLDPTRETRSLQLYHHILWLSREGLLVLEEWVLPRVEGYTELKILAYKLRASFYHIFVLFHNQPAVHSPGIITLPSESLLINGAASESESVSKDSSRFSFKTTKPEIIVVPEKQPSPTAGALANRKKATPAPPPGLAPVQIPKAASSFLLPALDYTPTATACFNHAVLLAERFLPGSHPLRLSIKLEYAAYLYDCLHDPAACRRLAKQAIADVYKAQEGMDDESFEDAAEIVSILGKMVKRGGKTSSAGGSTTPAGTPRGDSSRSEGGRTPPTKSKRTTTPKSIPTPRGSPAKPSPKTSRNFRLIMRSGFQKPGAIPFLALVVFLLLSLVPSLAKEWDFYNIHLGYIGYHRNDVRHLPRVKDASTDIRSRLRTFGFGGSCKSWTIDGSCQPEHLSRPQRAVLDTPRSAREADPDVAAYVAELSSFSRGVRAFKTLLTKQLDTRPILQHFSSTRDVSVTTPARLTSTLDASVTPVSACDEMAPPSSSSQQNHNTSAISSFSPMEAMSFLYESWQQACRVGNEYLEDGFSRIGLFRTPFPSSSSDPSPENKYPHGAGTPEQQLLPTRIAKNDSKVVPAAWSPSFRPPAHAMPTSALNHTGPAAASSKAMDERSEHRRGSCMAIVIGLVVGVMWF
ncbi:hypothetical protein FE257_007059 [Aspergillus nanangensis]|uniref:14-3-3 domain-containing protein n=1 Tax=Aspergillus nanangensis TaxID=2582783 RepID=A0AAD4GVR5_ASPNN|nr:hypothetical protein FE257_007059 [Aspergillus nanangensis]